MNIAANTFISGPFLIHKLEQAVAVIGIYVYSIINCTTNEDWL